MGPPVEEEDQEELQVPGLGWCPQHADHPNRNQGYSKALKSHILIFIELGRRISMVEGNRNRCHAYPIVTIYPWLLDVVGY